jgi:hypothetical protein
MADQQQQQQQPQVITLDNRNSVEILAQYIEVAQKAGAFLLPESDLLKRCRDVLLRGAEDQEVNVPTARNLFIQAVNKGQSKGAYSLEDASILHKVCQFVAQNLSSEAAAAPVPVASAVQSQVSLSNDDDDDDLSTLSDPVPLRSGPKTV